MKTTILIYAFLVGALFSDIINNLINERFQFIAIFLVVALDLVFGVAKALYKSQFETKKAMKSVYMLVAFWLLLAVVLVIEMAYSYISFLSEAILIPIILFQIISILKNMHVLGLISNELLTNLMSRIDKHKDVKTDE